MSTAATAISRSSSAWRPKYRDSLDAIRRITIGGAEPERDGHRTDPADRRRGGASSSPAPSFIYREDQERYIPIKFSVRGRDLGGAVLEAQQKIAEAVELPGGYRLEWVGEFGESGGGAWPPGGRRAAQPRPDLRAAVPQFRFAHRHAAGRQRHSDGADRRRLCAVCSPARPSASRRRSASSRCSASRRWTASSCSTYFNRLIDAGMDRAAAMLRACEVQMRPVLMTCIVACVGLLPAALSTGIGSPGAEAARRRRRRRHPAGTGADPDRAAGADRHVLAPHATTAGAGSRTRPRRVRGGGRQGFASVDGARPAHRRRAERLRGRARFHPAGGTGDERLHPRQAAGGDRVGRCRGRRRAALCRGPRHPRRVVDLVPLEGLEPAGRGGAEGEPDPGRGTGEPAPGRGSRLRRAGRLLPDRDGGLFGQPQQILGGPVAGDLDYHPLLQPLHAQCLGFLYARRLRRHPAAGRVRPPPRRNRSASSWKRPI